MRTVAIVQSSYIPWKGYFDLIAHSDVFVLFDDVQYTKRDWRNRNQIKTAQGPLWLTIPVHVKGRYFQKIREVEVAESSWAKQHWQTVRHAYSKAKAFDEYEAIFKDAYEQAASLTFLSEINELFIRAICGCLEISSEIRKSSELVLLEGKTEKLADICKQMNGERYLSGPSAADYIEPEEFSARGLDLAYFDYSGYEEYEQLFPPFQHDVSALDLIFNMGKSSKALLKVNKRSDLCHQP